MGRILAMAALALLGSSRAGAQITLSAGFETLHWVEDTRPRKVEERGPLATLELAWTRRTASPLRLAYRSRYYYG